MERMNHTNCYYDSNYYDQLFHETLAIACKTNNKKNIFNTLLISE